MAPSESGNIGSLNYWHSTFLPQTEWIHKTDKLYSIKHDL